MFYIKGVEYKFMKCSGIPLHFLSIDTKYNSTYYIINQLI